MSIESRKTILWVSIFAIAMGWFEAALVVYLRELFYSDGFFFPVIAIPAKLLTIEIVREFATIMMLIAVGVIAGRSKLEKFGYFMFAFGIWDIVYYIGLFIATGWPQSLLTWDLLFLIPLPWIGPVLAPVLVSLGMIFAHIVIVIQEDGSRPIIPSKKFWILEILCGLIIIFSFTIDFQAACTVGDPARFRWEIFLLGFIPGILLFLKSWRDARKS
jgi:hypothetical protein